MKKQIPALVQDEIKKLHEEISWQEGDVRGDFGMRHNGPEYFHAERIMIKGWIQSLRKNRFILQAIEKQIPMPIKVRAKLYLLPVEAEKGLFVVKRHYCQKCGSGIFATANGKKAEYCPYCGQKLWWRL